MKAYCLNPHCYKRLKNGHIRAKYCSDACRLADWHRKNPRKRVTIPAAEYNRLKKDSLALRKLQAR